MLPFLWKRILISRSVFVVLCIDWRPSPSTFLVIPPAPPSTYPGVAHCEGRPVLSPVTAENVFFPPLFCPLKVPRWPSPLGGLLDGPTHIFYHPWTSSGSGGFPALPICHTELRPLLTTIFFLTAVVARPCPVGSLL